MKVSVQNVMGCEQAEFQLEPKQIALIAGRNGGGKSSICRAVAAALSGESFPIPGQKKGQSDWLVRFGSEYATVILRGNKGTVTARWPGKFATQDDPPSASRIATGLTILSELDAKDRTSMFLRYLEAEPSLDELREKLNAAGLEVRIVADCVDLVRRLGWDSAAESRKESGARWKGAWEKITRANFGVKQSASWVPENWEHDLTGADETKLSEEIARIQDLLKSAIGKEAVSKAQREELAGIAGEYDARAEQFHRHGELLSEQEKALSEKRTELNALLSAPLDGGTQECPHCKGALQIKDGKIVKAGKGPSKKQIDDREATKLSLTAEISKLEADVEAGRKDTAELQSSLNESIRAKQRLESAVDEDPESDKLGAALKNANARLQMWRAKRDADGYFSQIIDNHRALEMLLPTGLRQEKLAEKLKGFNEQIKSLTTTAEWDPVTIMDDLSIRYGGKPYYLLSKSEQFRANVVLQVAFARLDNSSAVIIDGADILDGPGRTGLIKLLWLSQLPALITMTFSKKEDVPNLAAKEVGKTYWLEGAKIA